MFKINHIHLKAHDPKTTAQWYVDMFGAKIVGEGRGLGDSKTIRMDIDDVRVNVTSAPAGGTLPEGTAESHYGLEHFGFDVEDLDAELIRLKEAGARIVLPRTDVVGGTRLAYIEGPDDVLIELVQRT